ncbi:caspase family protein [Maridesulfovibrio bastinii]|uniref:caspase family protein n=1 Tax=Maridesulfovibrio bastinii TaxID=47157 RepID=UPI001FE0C02C|nr:caspase family protein [Maridesulfovibrio bastinii]
MALLIGNANYAFAPLRNPINDVRGMAHELQKLNFNVTELENVSQAGMIEAIQRLAAHANTENSIVVFYYAGHAVQMEGKNYLLPVSFRASSEAGVPAQSLCLDEILSCLEIKGNTNILILDACRVNPYDASTANYSGSNRAIRGLTIKMRNKGLAPMKGASGTFIAFSTSPGQPASDGEATHGLYTQYLLRYLAGPGLSIEEIFKKVRVAVLKESRQQQIPWERSSLLNDFYFIPPSKDELTKKSVRDLLQEARIDISAGRYGVAYKRLKIANAMSATDDEIQQIQKQMEKIKKELRE